MRPEATVEKQIIETLAGLGFHCERTKMRTRGAVHRTGGETVSIPDLLVHHAAWKGMYVGLEVKAHAKAGVKDHQRKSADEGVYGIAHSVVQALWYCHRVFGWYASGIVDPSARTRAEYRVLMLRNAALALEEDHD